MLVRGDEPYNEIKRYWADGVYRTEGAYIPLFVTISVIILAGAELLLVVTIWLFDIITGGETFVG